MHKNAMQGQGKVRVFCNWSGKFEILRKVMEIQEKWLVSQGNLTFSCLTCNNAAMPRIVEMLMSKLQYNRSSRSSVR